MSSKPTTQPRAHRRSRRQRLAAGAVLASTTLLGTYLAALRPQPTYASPNKGGAGQGQGLESFGRSFATFVRPACEVTVDDSTQLADAILASRDDSVICVNGTITLEDQPLPSIDDTRLTLMGAPGGSDDSIVVNVDDSALVGSILTGTFTTADDTLTIADLGFQGGQAKGYSRGGTTRAYGGAIYLNATDLVIHDSTFSGNTTEPNVAGIGGAIHLQDGDAAIYGTTFVDNRTPLTSGSQAGAIYVKGNVHIAGDSEFIDNRAAGYGGAVFALGGAISVVETLFRGNTSSGTGGALAAHSSVTSLTIADSVFDDNSGHFAGAVFSRAPSNSVSGSSEFTYNSSSSGAGAIGAGGAVTVYGSATFVDNSTGVDGGGALYVWSGDLSVSGAAFADNVSAGRGGAIVAFNDVTLTTTTLSDNQASGDGGAVWVEDDSLAATYVSLIDNETSSRGGAIFASTTADVSLTNSYVGGNSAAQGGAIFANSGRVSLAFSTVFDNAASSSAAGVAEAVQTGGLLTSVGSLVGNPQDDTVVTAGSIDDTFSISTGVSRVFNGTGSELVAPSALALGSRDGTGPGRQGRTPGVTSPLVTGAPSSGLTTGVTLDQLGVLRAGTWTIGSRQYVAPPPPPPVFPPSPPTNVTAVPGDRSAIVSWAAPASAGSFPVSTYRATASPGGQACLVAAPALTCTVTGLANGTPYTFTVEALSGGGWGEKSTPSASVTPAAVTPAPGPQSLPEPLAPGEALLQVDGVPDPNVTVEPNSSDSGLRIDGDGWSMALDGLGPDGKPLNLGPDGELRLQDERDVVTEGTGFLPNSQVDLYVDPPVLAAGSAARASTQAIYVGTVRTDASGNFAGTATLPEDIAPGEHVLQAAGYSPSRAVRAMSLGVVIEPSLVLDKGRRSADGRHDRIRTTGSSTGIEAGVKLTPWIRYSGQASFTQGKATITVQSDGTFRWTRQIRKDKGLTAYVSYVDVKSNEVFWAKVR